MAKVQGQIRLRAIDSFVSANRRTLENWAKRAKCEPSDLVLNITLEEPFRPRTTGYKSQNHALNGYIQQICEETGQDFASTKNYIKQMAIERGYPRLTKRTVKGIEDVVDWWGNPVGISESDASIEDCSKLIDCAIQLASEFGIRLMIGEEYT